MNVLIKEELTSHSIFFRCLSDKTRSKINKEMSRIDALIANWKTIAFENKIDVSKEYKDIIWLENDFRQIIDTAPEELNLIRVKIIKEKLGMQMMIKVHSQLKRTKVEADLKKELFEITRHYVLPWTKTAFDEKVDIKDEQKQITYAIDTEMDLLEKAKPFQREVIFRKQLVLRKMALCSIVKKIFSSRIDQYATIMKNKDCFDQNRMNEIEGIREDALHHLPSTQNLEKLITKCEAHLNLFKTNCILLDQHPEFYAKLADFEWLSRVIDGRASDLSKRVKENGLLLNQIEGIRTKAHTYMEHGTPLDEIIKETNAAFDLIEERLAKK